MSRVNELLAPFRRGDVKHVLLMEISDIGTGSSNRQDATEDGLYPFFVRSKEVLKSSVFEFDEEAIIIPGEGGIGNIFHYINGKYALHQRTYRIHLKTEKVSTKFLLYYMMAHFKEFILKKAVNATVSSIRKPMIEQFSVPLLPLSIQQEIVHILDSFTELNVELNAELDVRRTQYEYYKDQLLSSNLVVKFKRLSECCHLEKGQTPIQKAIPGKYPLVVTTTARKSCNNYQFDKPTVCIPLVSSRGHGVASLNRVYYQEGKFALGNILCGVTPIKGSGLLAKYLYYYLNYKKDVLLVPLMRGGANVSLKVDSIMEVKIPIPVLSVQEDIIKKLECFDAICNDPTCGLPAEIAARQTQYEYYRDKLLTFKELKA